MKDFYSTIGGRRLCDGTLPEIARQLKRVADEMKRANNLKERELKSVHGLSLADEAKAFMEGHENVFASSHIYTPSDNSACKIY